MTVRVDRVTLRVRGVSRDEGARLAALVARRLGTVRWGGSAAAMRVTLDARADEPVEATADRIVGQLSTPLGGSA
jgi:hypothetical protein